LRVPLLDLAPRHLVEQPLLLGPDLDVRRHGTRRAQRQAHQPPAAVAGAPGHGAHALDNRLVLRHGVAPVLGTEEAQRRALSQ
jgi:hypothetical protein